MVTLDLSENLRLLCTEEKSVSEVCRSIGLNRQQFGKYLAGTSQPSRHNLLRICKHFGVQTSDLFLPHSEFASRMEFRSSSTTQPPGSATHRALRRAFPGDRRGLTRYLGFYFSHFHSFSWDGYILRSLICVYEQDGMICTKTIERNRDPVERTLYRSKYDGYLSLHGNRIFAVEFESLAQDAVVETVLYPTGRSQLTLLRGVTFGISSKQRNPYVSRVVWKYLGPTVDYRAVLSATGLLAINGGSVEPNILRILGNDPFPNNLLHYDLEPTKIR